MVRWRSIYYNPIFLKEEETIPILIDYRHVEYTGPVETINRLFDENEFYIRTDITGSRSV
jgi:hypothetical protein